MTKWYGIWCFDRVGKTGGDWLREDYGLGVIAYSSRVAARRRAARSYAFDTYAEASQAGWCEVRPLGENREQAI